MKVYHGSCHCGRVRFEIETDMQAVSQCNCSICRKKGTINHRVRPEHFRLLSGEEALTLYQFNTMTAKHYFCKYCGIHPFTHPRAAPELYTVNVRCLDDFDLEAEAPELYHFNGRNWEEAIKAYKPRTT